MKANNRRKVFGDAVDLLMEDIEEKTAPGGLRMLSIKKIRPFHDHPFHLYEGDRLEDMVSSRFSDDASSKPLLSSDSASSRNRSKESVSSVWKDAK